MSHLPTGTARPALAACLLVLVGCGPSTTTSGHGDTGSGVTVDADGAQHVRLDGSGDDRFSPSTFHVHTGAVMIELHNTGGAPHDLTFDDATLKSTGTILSEASGSIWITIRRPGRYPFVCTIHERQGMRGMMIVDPR